MEKCLTMYEMVKEFHKAFNTESDPTTPQSYINCFDLRQKLITEEYKEVLEEMGYSVDIKLDRFGSGEVNIINLSKELADLLYVVLGTAAAYGIPIDDVYREVHRSNMSKLAPDGTVLYREDGKVLKGPNYSPADIKKVLALKEVDEWLES